MDVAADMSSYESFSFAGLPSIQDLQSKPPPTNSINCTMEQDQEFEISYTALHLTLHNSNKNCPADMSISNPQQQEFLGQSKHQMAHSHKPASEIAPNNKKLNNRNYIDGARSSHKQNSKEKNQVKPAASSMSFAQKILQSSRTCHTRTSTVKAQREVVELH